MGIQTPLGEKVMVPFMTAALSGIWWGPIGRLGSSPDIIGEEERGDVLEWSDNSGNIGTLVTGT